MMTRRDSTPRPAASDRLCMQFYQEYAAACDELGIVPLAYPALLALLATLAERPTATLD